MFINIPSTKLKQLVKLSERKEELMAQIQEIDRAMLQIESEFGQPSESGVRKAPLTFSAAPRKKGARRHAKK
jgi:flagellar biosynthesis/type III secretory pathway chaperone